MKLAVWPESALSQKNQPQYAPLWNRLRVLGRKPMNFVTGTRRRAMALLLTGLMALNACGDDTSAVSPGVQTDAGADGTAAADGDAATGNNDANSAEVTPGNDVFAGTDVRDDADDADAEVADAPVEADAEIADDGEIAEDADAETAAEDEFDAGTDANLTDGELADGELTDADLTDGTDAEDGASDTPTATELGADAAEVEADSVVDTADSAGGLACVYGGDCPAGASLCAPNGTCVQCVYDVQCLDKTMACVGGSCVPAKTCASDLACLASGQVCSATSGVCVECATANDCGSGQICWHDTCVTAPATCKSSKECAGFGLCSAGKCVNCANDADCGLNNWCMGDVCVPDSCTAGETQCSSASDVKICAENGSGWVAGSCPSGTTCFGGTCKAIVCTPDTTGCSASGPGVSIAWACDSSGTNQIFVPCGNSQTCVGGACLESICTPNDATCVDGKVETCNSTGTGKSSSSCGSSGSCIGGGCVPWVCLPGGVTCVDNTATNCDSNGQFGSVANDCTLNAQVCVGGTCVSPVCSSGQTTCLDSGHLGTCAADGLSWISSGCGDSAVCVGDKCAAIVCTPNASSCKNQTVFTCNALGTELQFIADCASQSAVCLTDQCVPIICKPGSTKCTGPQLSTCNSSGTAWDSVGCSSNTICDGSTCAPIVCTPGASVCANKIVSTCNDLGTKYVNGTDCGASGQICSKGNCVTPLCQAGQTTCSGTTLSTCNADGLSVTKSTCDDSNTCTSDGCDTILGSCSHFAINCDDGNICTIDSCSGGCKHVANTEACNDGNPCTTGETCASGTCVATSGSGTASTVAGTGTAGWLDGPGSSAQLKSPVGVARMMDGTIVFVESTGLRVRAIDATGNVSTVAGSGSTGSADGPSALASFNSASGIATGKDGSIYVADTGNNRIRRIRAGAVTTLTGSNSGFADGAGSSALFKNPTDIAVDASGMIWVADSGNNRIRLVAPSGKTSSFAGTGTAGYVDGPSSSAQFSMPCALAVASDGSIYVADCNNGRIRRIVVSTGSVSTVVGAGNGFQDGAGTSALFGKMLSLAFQGSTLIVSDAVNNRIRSVSPGGIVATLAGSSTGGFLDGAGASALFNAPRGITVDWSNQIWIADSANNRIRKIKFANAGCDDSNACTTDSCNGQNGCVFTPVSDGATCNDSSGCTSGDVCTGGVCGGSAKSCVDGNFCTDDFCMPSDGSCDYVPLNITCSDGNPCTTADFCINASCSSGTSILTTLAGGNTVGFKNDVGGGAAMYDADGIVVVAPDRAWFSDKQNAAIRQVTVDGAVTTIAGGTPGFVDGDVSVARFSSPGQLAIDSAGVVYVADSGNNRIRKMSGTNVSSVAGSGTSGYLDGSGSTAQFSAPGGIAVDSSGILYVADTGNRRIRTIAKDGTVSTLAGSGSAGSSDGVASSATFTEPLGVCVDSASGTVYVADGVGDTIRRISAGQVSTFAGSGSTFGMLDAKGTLARFNRPIACTVDSDHNVWVVDGFNFRVRRITPTGIVATIAGASTPPSSSSDPGTKALVDGSLSGAIFVRPRALAIASPGIMWVADYSAIRRLILAAPNCDDGEPCTTDSCDGATGSCKHVPLTDASVCDDGNACTTDERCNSGVCKVSSLGGTTTNCDDGKFCTTDTCSVTGGCAHTNSTDPCDDGKPCTSGDTCTNGSCVPTGNTCEDNNLCTDDLCDSVGACSHVNNTLSCAADSNGCTLDICAGGICTHNLNCDDGIACTKDACSTDTTNPYVCTHAPLGSVPCDDGFACSSNDTCTGGACKGTIKSCDDNSACTTDYCNATTGGCQYVAKCDDSNPCTDDACDATTGACTHSANTASCSDGLGCTASDTCASGVCKGTAIVCSSGTCTEPSGCGCPAEYIGLINDGKIECVPDYPAWGLRGETPASSLFTDNGDGTVTDSQTGLMWQKAMSSSATTYGAAKTACGGLSFAGKADWRLPTRAELLSIIDYKATGGAFVSSLPGSVAAYTWSAVTFGGSSNSTWSVCFDSGSSVDQLSAATLVSRCVRTVTPTTAPATRFTVSVSGNAVSDAATGLTWQRDGTASTLLVLSDAKTYCTNLSTDGGGWRLPNIVELSSLIDSQVFMPSIETTPFPSTPVDTTTWSSTPDANAAGFAWIVSFGTGATGTVDQNAANHVRCVR